MRRLDIRNRPAYFFSICFILSLIGNRSFAQTTGKDPVDLVNPVVDAANSRWFFFNSASRPFGMVNLSPDNAVNADWGAGYRYHLDSIKCFSHIHGWQLSGIPVIAHHGRIQGTSGPRHIWVAVFAQPRSDESRLP